MSTINPGIRESKIPLDLPVAPDQLSGQAIERMLGLIPSVAQVQQKLLTGQWMEIKGAGRTKNPSVVAWIPPLSAVPQKGQVLGLDLIGTLIEAKDGAGVPHGDRDWVWTCDRGQWPIPKYLNWLNKHDVTIAIFSNYFKMSAERIETAKRRVMIMMQQLDFEPFVFMSMKEDSYSKPNIGMWQLFQETKIPIDPKSRYTAYCGDRFFTSGRYYIIGDPASKHAIVTTKPIPGSTSRDIVIGTDRKSLRADADFAAAIGLRFLHPTMALPQRPDYVPSGQKELAILVGNQGAGKSTIARSLQDQHRYAIVTREGKYQNRIAATLQAGQSVVFDATNPSANGRAELIILAKQYQAKPVILWLPHNGRDRNSLRELLDVGKHVPAIAYRTYESQFIEPTTAEGAEIFTVTTRFE
jgi:DNA 3'-phosphatase